MIFSTSFVIEIMPAKYNDNIYLAPFTPDEDLLPGNKSCAPLSYCKATGRLVITGRVHCHITSCLCSRIYISFVVTTSSWMATWMASLLWCLLFMNKYRWWAFLGAKCICYYMFMNHLPCHCTYCLPLFSICCYSHVQTIALLEVKDI